MRCLVFLLVLHIPFMEVKAAPSPQMPDYIIFRKDTLATYTLILEQYLDKKDNKNLQLFGLRFSDEASFNCWRGYQAIYKIENDSLFLVDIIDCGGLRHINKKESLKRIRSLFGEKIVNERVYIDWFSGSIKFPLSDNVLRWDGVFYKVFEKETVINITAGKILTIQNVSNYVHVRNGIDRRDKREISKKIFRQVKKTRWKYNDDCDCSEDYDITIDTNGRVSNVVMTNYSSVDSIDKYWDRAEYDYCINTMLKALRKMKFDIIRDKGKPIRDLLRLKIWFMENGKMENQTE